MTMIDWSKLKSFADDNLNVTRISKFVFDRIVNIAGKSEIAGNHNVFRRLLSRGRYKLGLCGKQLIINIHN